MRRRSRVAAPLARSTSVSASVVVTSKVRLVAGLPVARHHPERQAEAVGAGDLGVELGLGDPGIAVASILRGHRAGDRSEAGRLRRVEPDLVNRQPGDQRRLGGGRSRKGASGGKNRK